MYEEKDLQGEQRFLVLHDKDNKIIQVMKSTFLLFYPCKNENNS